MVIFLIKFLNDFFCRSFEQCVIFHIWVEISNSVNTIGDISGNTIKQRRSMINCANDLLRKKSWCIKAGIERMYQGIIQNRCANGFSQYMFVSYFVRLVCCFAAITGAFTILRQCKFYRCQFSATIKTPEAYACS